MSHYVVYIFQPKIKNEVGTRCLLSELHQRYEMVVLEHTVGVVGTLMPGLGFSILFGRAEESTPSYQRMRYKVGTRTKRETKGATFVLVALASSPAHYHIYKTDGRSLGIRKDWKNLKSRGKTCTALNFYINISENSLYLVASRVKGPAQ